MTWMIAALFYGILGLLIDRMNRTFVTGEHGEAWRFRVVNVLFSRDRPFYWMVIFFYQVVRCRWNIPNISPEDFRKDIR